MFLCVCSLPPPAPRLHIGWEAVFLVSNIVSSVPTTTSPAHTGCPQHDITAFKRKSQIDAQTNVDVEAKLTNKEKMEILIVKQNYLFFII